MAAKNSGQEKESIETIVNKFRKNLEDAFLSPTGLEKVPLTNNNNSEDLNSPLDENKKCNGKAKKRCMIDENKGVTKKCNKMEDNCSSSSDCNKILQETDQQNSSEINLENTPVMMTGSNDHMTKKKSDAYKKESTNIDGEASRLSSNVNLKFRCSFCTESFPSLIEVRGHIWSKHEEENKERKLNEFLSSMEQYEDVNDDPKLKERLVSRKIRNSKSEPLLLYFCNACKFASLYYDCMIQHCQDHIISDEDSEHLLNKPKRKRYLLLKGQKYNVDSSTAIHEYIIGSSYHSTDKLKHVDCNYKLLKSDKSPAIFDMFSKHEIDRINCASIYNFTRVIRLSSNNKSTSAPFMLYQCMRCMTYVDPHSILLHVQQNSCHEKANRYPCYDCERPFCNENAMYLHYKTHKVADADKKYKSILFNEDKDFYTNALLLKAAGIQISYAASGKYAMPQKSSMVAPQDSLVEHIKEINGPQIEDARTMIIQGTSVAGETKNDDKNIADNTVTERVAEIYKCGCGLCFHSLESLSEHLKNGHNTMLQKRVCICGLQFDETHYSMHYEMHSQGFTAFNVKRVTISNEETIDVKNIQHQFNEPNQN